MVTLPPRTTSAEVQAAAASILETAARCEWGARTIPGTPGHQAACRLEAARLLTWNGTVEVSGAVMHSWLITNLGRHDYEASQTT